MKTTFLKSAALLLFVVFAFSCNNDDDSSNDENFFNLNVGNQWVYKKYHNMPDPDVLVYAGVTDSVKIQQNVTLNGLNFAKVQLRKFENGTLISTENEYWRVNTQGHLICVYAGEIDNPEIITENYGWVLHPGADASFTTTESDEIGSLFYHLLDPIDLTVEGQQYNVTPYVGDFSPNGQSNYTKRTEYNYEPNTGLVKRVCHQTLGTYKWEDRLVSATIVD